MKKHSIAHSFFPAVTLGMSNMVSTNYVTSLFETSTSMVILIITLAVIGGIFYQLLISIRGFGGMLGTAFKFFGVGVFLLALNTLSQYGSELYIREGVLIKDIHYLISLLGFLFLALGLARLTAIVRGGSK